MRLLKAGGRWRIGSARIGRGVFKGKGRWSVHLNGIYSMYLHTVCDKWNHMISCSRRITSAAAAERTCQIYTLSDRVPRGEKLSSTAALLPDEMYVMEHPVHILWSVDSTTWQPLIALSHGFSIPLIASHQLQQLREIQGKNKKLCWPLLAAEI